MALGRACIGPSFRSLFLGLLLLVPVATAQAAPKRTVYVSPTGNDTAAGTAAAPWKTLQFAANQAKAGDLIVVKAGNYAGFNMTKSGTATNRIIWRAEAGAVINSPLSLSGNLYGINASGVSYVTIEGFTFAPQSSQGEWYAAIRMGGTPDNWAKGNIIRNNVAQMRVVNQATTPDKYGIYSSWQDGIVVENNKVSGGYNSGIYTANSSKNYIIRNNEVFDVGGNGIHNNGDLGAGAPGIIYNALIEGNVIHNVGFGIGGQAISCDGVQDSRIQNNLIYEAHAKGISLYAQDAAEGCKRTLVFNNTVVTTAKGQVALRMNEYSSQNTVVNNIFFGGSAAAGSWANVEEKSTEGMVCDYNIVGGRPMVGSVPRKDWKETYKFDSHSLPSTPEDLFVDPAKRDYRLKAGSPAIDAGTEEKAPKVDLLGKARPFAGGVDIGAYESEHSGVPPMKEPPVQTPTDKPIEKPVEKPTEKPLQKPTQTPTSSKSSTTREANPPVPVASQGNDAADVERTRPWLGVLIGVGGLVLLGVGVASGLLLARRR